jgi:hypothetical protein
VTPCAAISSFTAAKASVPRAQTDTAAPASAQASAIARPIPRLPPVMTARLLVSSIFIAPAPIRFGRYAIMAWLAASSQRKAAPVVAETIRHGCVCLGED